MNTVVVRRHLRAVFAAWLVVSLAIGQMLYFSPSVPEVAAQEGRPALPPGIVRLPFAGEYQITQVPGCGFHDRNNSFNSSKWAKEVNGRSFDFGLPANTRVLAAGDGRVLQHYVDPNGAKILIIDHGNNVRSYYAHLSQFNVPVGQDVRAGQFIGLSGNTGFGAAYHLHFAVTTDGNPASTGNAANVNSLPGIPWNINHLNSDGYVTNCTATPNERAVGPAENTAPSAPPPSGCTTGYKLSVNKPVAVLPDPISVGQEVWAETEIINNGCAEYKGNIYLGGRGPDGSIQDFVEQPVVIPPNGGKVTYKQKRTFSIVGSYKFTMGRVDENGHWQVIDNGAATRFSSLVVDTTCRIGYQLSVEQDLNVAPQQAANGQAVTGRAVIVNKGCAPYEGTIYFGGRGPGGADDIQDYPGQKVRIEPNGGTVVYEQSRSFKTLGTYNFAMGRTDEQGNWQEIPAGAGKRTGSLTLTSNCNPQPLVVTTSLAVSSKEVAAGQPVTVTWTVKNANPAECAPVTMGNLGSAVRGPGGIMDNQDMAYAKDIPIPSGQSFVYKNTKKFETPGEYRVWIAAFGEQNAWYAVAPSANTVNGTTFNVKPAGPGSPPASNPGNGGNPAGGPTVTVTPLVVNGTVVPPAEPPTEIAIPVTPPSSGPVSKGSIDPSFSGDRLPVVASAGTDNATSPGRTQDNNPGTSWASWRWYPSNASFVLDLGQVSTLSGVKWMVLEPNQTPFMTIDISTDGVSWTTVGTFSNLKEISQWYGITATGEARYVRFALTNTTGQFMLGKISGVEIWGTQKETAETSGEQPGENPGGGSSDLAFTGEQLAIASSDGTTNATSSNRAWDSDPGTSWATFSNAPQFAFFTLDLGAPMAISGVKWMVLETGYSDWLDVSMSVDGVTWVPVGRFGNPTSAYSWIGTQTSGQAQYIRFTFSNVAGTSMLGKIAEVQVWGGPIAAQAAGANANGTPSADADKKVPSAAGKTPPTTAKTPAAAGKTPPANARPTAKTAKPTEKASASQPKVGIPTKMPVKTPAKSSPTEKASSGQPKVATVPTKASTKPATNSEGSSQPAIQTTGDQAKVPTSVVQQATTPASARTAPPVTPTVAAAFAGDSADGPTPTPIVFDGDQLPADGPTVTPVLDTNGPTVTPPTASDGLTVTPVTDAPVTVTPTLPGPTETPAPDAGDVVTPTPLVFDGDQPEPPTETPVADGPVTEVPVTEVPVTEVSTVTPTPDVATVESAITETVDVPTETPTAIVFGGEEPLVTETPVEAGVTETVVAEVTEVVTEIVETETVPVEAITPTPTETPTLVPTETPAADQGSLYAPVAETETETPADAAPEETVTEAVVTEEVIATEISTEVPVEMPTETPAEFATEIPTEEPPTEEPPTEVPTPEVTPLSIVTIGDSEGSQEAVNAADFDPNTVWSVYPSLSLTEARLTLDLGQTQPVASIELDLDERGLLPNAEVWLSEDGVTWWNVTSFDARQMQQSQPGQPVTISLGYWTRYIALVVPYADTLGMPEIGGIREMRVWAAEESEPVGNLVDAGQPTTPVPVPTEVMPTEVVATEPVVEETVAPVETEPPADDGDGGDEVVEPEG